MKVNTVVLRHVHFYTNSDYYGEQRQNQGWGCCQNRDHSWNQESRDAVLARTIAESVALQTQSIAEMFAQQNREAVKEMQSIAEAYTRQMEKAHAQYQDLLKETRTAALPTTLKVTSSTDGFRVMDPFDWTLDKNVYQRWQLWSHKARLALEAMEGDTEKTKIPTCTIGLMVKAFPKLKDGKTARLSSFKQNMMH